MRKTKSTSNKNCLIQRFAMRRPPAAGREAGGILALICATGTGGKTATAGTSRRLLPTQIINIPSTSSAVATAARLT